MNLTAKLLNELTESMMVALTREQRAILLDRYRVEPRYGWDEEDFVFGIREVIRQYPDHRLKPEAFPYARPNRDTAPDVY